MREELLVTAKKKYKEVMANPDSSDKEKRFNELLVKFFENEDAIREAPSNIAVGALVYYGHRIKEASEMYKELMEEVNKKYVLIHPDQVKDAMKK